MDTILQPLVLVLIDRSVLQLIGYKALLMHGNLRGLIVPRRIRFDCGNYFMTFCTHNLISTLSQNSGVGFFSSVTGVATYRNLCFPLIVLHLIRPVICVFGVFEIRICGSCFTLILVQGIHSWSVSSQLITAAARRSFRAWRFLLCAT